MHSFKRSNNNVSSYITNTEKIKWWHICFPSARTKKDHMICCHLRTHLPWQNRGAYCRHLSVLVSSCRPWNRPCQTCSFPCSLGWLWPKPVPSSSCLLFQTTSLLTRSPWLEWHTSVQKNLWSWSRRWKEDERSTLTLIHQTHSIWCSSERGLAAGHTHRGVLVEILMVCLQISKQEALFTTIE